MASVYLALGAVVAALEQGGHGERVRVERGIDEAMRGKEGGFDATAQVYRGSGSLQIVGFRARRVSAYHGTLASQAVECRQFAEAIIGVHHQSRPYPQPVASHHQ